MPQYSLIQSSLVPTANMRFATLAIVLPIALTTAFPIAPAIVQIIKPHPPRAAEAVAEAIFDPPPDHSGAISVPIPPRSLFQRIATAVKGRECYHANSHPGHCPHHRRSARSDDARGATIYKEPDLKGENTFIPANDYCTDMTNIFGGFDGNVRSVSVEKGVKCTFYK